MSRDEEVKQAIGAVARLGGFTIKRVATTDDLKDRSLTITLTRPSDGWVQERLDFEDIPPLTAEVNGRGEVERLNGLQPGDHAETEAQANAEIATAAETNPDETGSSDPPRDPAQPLVGELAAAARKRR